VQQPQDRLPRRLGAVVRQGESATEGPQTTTSPELGHLLAQLLEVDFSDVVATIQAGPQRSGA
jgi:hypothetical protein